MPPSRKIYRRVEAPMAENVCAENNLQFDYHMPVANRPGF
jgi:hypothetical protein